MRFIEVITVPVRQHRLEPQHERAHHAVADHVRAARVGRDVAADRARAARAEVEREEQPDLLGGGLQRLQRAAGLHGGRAADGIDFLDGRHALERDDDVLRARAIPVAHAGKPAVDDDGLATRMAQLHDVAQLPGRRGPHERARLEWRRVPVVARACAKRIGAEHAGRADDRLQ
jgi:hypothetical protein